MKKGKENRKKKKKKRKRRGIEKEKERKRKKEKGKRKKEKGKRKEKEKEKEKRKSRLWILPHTQDPTLFFQINLTPTQNKAKRERKVDWQTTATCRRED